MDKEELYDLIERYLDGALSDAEHQEVERRMATEADFRAEVELHRALHASLGDRGNFHLRTVLDDLLSNPPHIDDTSPHVTAPTLKPPTNWFKLAVILALLVVVCFIIWKWLAPGTATTQPDSPQSGQNQQIDTASSPGQNLPSDTASIPVRPKISKPIAMADPADFVPNPVLEARIGDNARSQSAEVKLLSPDTSSTWRLRGDNTVTIPFEVSIGSDLFFDNLPFKVFIYSNRPQDWEKKKTEFERDLSFAAIGNDEYKASFRQKLSLTPGLYYIVVGQQRTSDVADGYITLYIGKITILQ